MHQSKAYGRFLNLDKVSYAFAHQQLLCHMYV